MKTHLKQTAESTLAKPLAPEDVREGDYVAVLDETFEVPALLWLCDSSLRPPDEVLRIRLRPQDPTPPMRVEAICLPYLTVKTVSGKTKTLDLRAVRVARLDKKYAKRVSKALFPSRKKGIKKR